MYLMKHYFEQTWEMQSQENSDLQLKLKKLQASEPPGLDSKSQTGHHGTLCL